MADRLKGSLSPKGGPDTNTVSVSISQANRKRSSQRWQGTRSPIRTRSKSRSLEVNTLSSPRRCPTSHRSSPPDGLTHTHSQTSRTESPLPKAKRPNPTSSEENHSKKVKKETTTGSNSSSRRHSSRLTSKSSPAAAAASSSSSSVNTLSHNSAPSTSKNLVPSSSKRSLRGASEMDENGGKDAQSSASTSAAPTVGLLELAPESGPSSAPSGSSGPVSGDSESDENDMGRLQALLEARGLPPHLFGALAPRVQTLLQRSVGPNTVSKAHQLLQGLEAHGDEGQQLQAVMEMSQVLVMGNEDTLGGFPVKQVVPALINLLNMEHNFDIMNHACRALTYMMESLPRSSAVVVEAVPAFLQKLQSIHCMDVAEQSLTALEMLSRRHSKSILHAKGVTACLTYLDFFSINAQRSALSITANCCQNVTPDEFSLVKDALETLSTHLNHQDKKCVESICLAFSRLVDCYQNHPELLESIAQHNLLTNLQQLLAVNPPLISTGTFQLVLRMMATMCSSCPQLAVQLLQLNISETIRFLLLGPNASNEDNECLELVSRSPQELYEITSLIVELMPQLPKDGIFTIDVYLSKPQSPQIDVVGWQWKDDRGVWHSYSVVDSKLIEAAHQSGEDEVNLHTMGRTYMIDFNTMQQINEDTGTSRPVQRKVNPNSESMSALNTKTDPRIECLKEQPHLLRNFIKSLFGVLYEVYSSSAGPAVRHKCLRALLRIVYYSPSDLLRSLLKNQAVSSHIAAMLASPDLKVVVGAIQMANILMEKLPDVFGTYFSREGVLHQMSKLANGESPETSSSTVTLTVGGKTESSVPSTSSSLISSHPSSTVYDTNSNVSPSGSYADMREAQKASWSSASGDPTTTHTSSSGPSPSTLTTGGGGSQANTFVPQSGTGFRTLEESMGSLPEQSSQKSNENLKRKRNARKSGPMGHGGSSATGARKARNDGENPRGCSEAIDAPHMNRNISTSAYEPNALHMSFASNPASLVAIPCQLTPPSSGLSQSPTTSLNIASGSMSAGNSRGSRSSGGFKPFTSAAAKTSSLFANILPARWGRWTSSSSSLPASTVGANIASRATFSPDHVSLSSFSLPRSPNYHGNREKVKAWIKEQAKLFEEKYISAQESIKNESSLIKLVSAVENLDREPIKALSEFKAILADGDLSSFELNHSGVISKLINYLTRNDSFTCDRYARIRLFLYVFMGCPPDNSSTIRSKLDLALDPSPFISLVNKLNACVSQLEQFPVRVHDVIGTGSGSSRGTSALKFFNTHQLKCNLQRHPECTNLRQWRGGPVKIDPLALVQAIERYLVSRGYGRIREDDDDNTDDENSDEDLEGNMAAMMIGQQQNKHRLEFLINDHVLPYNVTVYQAIKQSLTPYPGDQDGEMESEALIGHANIWVQTHTIYYRPYVERNSSSSSPSANSVSNQISSRRSSSKSSSNKSSWSQKEKKKDDLWSDGKVPTTISPVDKFLELSLPSTVTVMDASLEVINLLRILYGISRYWGWFYNLSFPYNPAVPQSEFVNNKLTAKANRQLQDPLVIMTGNLPAWLSQIAYSCPFLLPFETRHLLFYVTCFDRDRALQRLLDTQPDLGGNDSSERVTPRLERRKKTVSRDELLKQAETVLQDIGNSKALLEIQYENEVGTGLGPTLEFYALVSKELQRADLEMWRGECVSSPNTPPQSSGKIHATSSSSDTLLDSHDVHGKDKDVNGIKFVYSPNGLFPAPISRSVKTSHATKLKNKFKLLGKFMAKALMDARMLDIPLSPPFYQWLLSQESVLNLSDMFHIDQTLARSVAEMDRIAQLKHRMTNVENSTQSVKLESLTLDGCPIEDLNLDFTLPGYPSIELRKGGKDIVVNIDNVENYVRLLCHWTLHEGVHRQMEAFKEGFDSVFSSSHLELFFAEELEQLFCGSQHQQWDVKTLEEYCKTDHGYAHDSRAIKFLFEILSSYNQDEQRKFLQFVTGSPRLPVGGLKSLSPPLTIVRKTHNPGEDPDQYLPSVMTCVNYLKLPDYSSVEVMRHKLKIAASEGQNSFHLS